MNMKPKDYAEEIANIRGLSQQSIRSYKHTLTLYSQLNEMSLDNLLKEAEEEE